MVLYILLEETDFVYEDCHIILQELIIQLAHAAVILGHAS